MEWESNTLPYLFNFEEMEWESNTLFHSAEKLVKNQLDFIGNYVWLIDSFLAEFFVEDLWRRIPLSWQECLKKISMDEFHYHISPNVKRQNISQVLPLSLLSFIASSHFLALPRKHNHPVFSSVDSSNNKQLPHSFRRHVKVKKQYEVKHLSQLVRIVAEQTGCTHVVDVGGGLGHLSRYLAFEHNLQVVTIESEGHHKTTAEKFDKETLRDIQRLKLKTSTSPQVCSEAPPVHVTKMVPLDIEADEFMNTVLSARGKSQSRCSEQNLIPLVSRNGTAVIQEAPILSKENFVLVGLHTCGDLSPTMIRTFVNCKGAKAIVLIGCCYMKLTCQDGELSADPQENNLPAANETDCSRLIDSDMGGCNTAADRTGHDTISNDTASITSYSLETCDYCYRRSTDDKHVRSCCSPRCFPKHSGFPMSRLLRSQARISIGWDALELACHNFDNYCQRIIEEKGKLKTQCYRAALEVVIRKVRPDLKNPQIRCQKIKGASRMTFDEYANAALRRINIDMPPEELLEELNIDCLLSRWKDVIMFYCLRLLLGPVIESLVLTDRLLHLQEHGLKANLHTVFDAKISPRNFALVSIKS